MAPRSRDMEADLDAATLLEAAGFDPDLSVLTRRQAEVLALREHGVSQADIAEQLGTSRANVAGIEASARENVAKARETLEFVEAVQAPVRVQIDDGTDIFDVPDRVYEEADDAGIKVSHSATELVQTLNRAVGGAMNGRELTRPIVVSVGTDGSITVREAGNNADP